MPTKLDRIQCLMGPETYAQVLTLAKHNRRTKSNMAHELIEFALKHAKYSEQLDQAAVTVPPKEDPRTHRQDQLHRAPSEATPNAWWEVVS